jgi:hypothetical protein
VGIKSALFRFTVKRKLVAGFSVPLMNRLAVIVIFVTFALARLSVLGLADSVLCYSLFFSHVCRSAGCFLFSLMCGLFFGMDRSLNGFFKASLCSESFVLLLKQKVVIGFVKSRDSRDRDVHFFLLLKIIKNKVIKIGHKKTAMPIKDIAVYAVMSIAVSLCS